MGGSLPLMIAAAPFSEIAQMTRDLNKTDMNQRHGAYGEALGSAFGLYRPPTVISRALHKATLAVTELRCEPKFGLTAPLPREDAYLVALQLRACHDHDLYFDGRLIRPTHWDAGVTTIYDLRQQPVADMRDPGHSLMFYLPRVALNAVAAEAGSPSIDELRYRRAVGIDDTVARQLLSSVLPAIAQPEHAHPLFLDHVVLAMASHMAYVYGGVSPGRVHHRGGLASWQIKRATEMMSESLTEGPALSQLAEECGLSARHFARAFRESTGVPPHRWLLRHRVQRAQAMLRVQALPLADIALRCGFADQSHFTRVFSREVGLSPGQWRRGQ
jgi:AraC family transcriptional regulator